MFSSGSLIEAGIYPNRTVMPAAAEEACSEFLTGRGCSLTGEAVNEHWFNTYNKDYLDDVYVTEEYVTLPSMDTLWVLLTIDESDLCFDDGM
jgi:hypothetical protein